MRNFYRWFETQDFLSVTPNECRINTFFVDEIPQNAETLASNETLVVLNPDYKIESLGDVYSETYGIDNTTMCITNEQANTYRRFIVINPTVQYLVQIARIAKEYKKAKFIIVLHNKAENMIDEQTYLLSVVQNRAKGIDFALPSKHNNVWFKPNITLMKNVDGERYDFKNNTEF